MQNTEKPLQENAKPLPVHHSGHWMTVNGVRYSEFTPDIAPLEAMLSMTHLDLREIDRRMQQERHMNRRKLASDFKAELTLQERCPKCTLKPPCQHFERAD